MKQVLQNLSNGETNLSEVPCPQPKHGSLLIATTKSLVSVGTERMLIDFGKANFIEKARQQPDKVKMVLDKVKTDGLLTTVETVKSKLEQPLTLGYCNVGKVIDSGGTDFDLGTRVVSNGNHAEVVRVPKNLCARVPNNVSDEEASFTVLSSIALQGIRLVKPTLGECVVVTGLGLIGLITVQLLRANGCRVLGIDFDSTKCNLARELGAEVVDLSKGEDPIKAAEIFSRGRGVDAVIITASTKSNEPMSQAAKMSRKQGRIVLVGVVGLELSRADFFEKELTFQVSCSYGAGRYDSEYEEKGHDYPVGYVRWTEQRNFEAVLDMMSTGALDVKPLITHRYSINDAIDAYKCLDDRSSLGIILDYPNDNVNELSQRLVTISSDSISYKKSDAVCTFVGAGNYASRILIPAFKNGGAKLDTVVTSGGVSAVHHGDKQGFAKASTDFSEAMLDNTTNTVVIATQHNLHAEQVIRALQAGKNVFVEKPLALNEVEIDSIEKVYNELEVKPRLMVGYNRRFAPQIIKMKELISSVSGPKTFIMTMNAGDIPSEHWTQDINIGGGRIIGEACHYIDLMRHLVGAKITGFNTMCIGGPAGVTVREDKATITLSFEDGSIGTIHYFANGGKVFPKERIEVFANDAVLQLDNFRKLIGFGWKGFTKSKLLSQDKGQNNCARIFIESINKGNSAPILFDEIIEVAKISCQVAESLR
ncbi:TPA: bi-domain-containing oxidoreductase [Vibrio parahaemolyticus]|uniref:Myo-inositol 2-dehydrogenase n=1 Tax=Vibrio parahaemolyticus TaxID=670 RepID=A0A7M1WN58_VIBPH|nr:bi-domain-containing oxidoreductase [Vibrio parahaemolyticus]MBT0005769.1 bi-domain-containing oxidoreductase [Vibrio alginolyticus]EID0729989.1 bi-domain-containing oxidoreductase [Vibrio parahaemolyticus]ELN6867945.1 bi-domain-containing oxidoreductase [Vibrio parahaemolyticus]MDI7833599.1 bi-domain-containing oxidoreductase [Vibrio parahaemolyticus]QOS28517.1 myo-inositol 2-dehydrogenase [Vibrio parahaemolyticus]